MSDNKKYLDNHVLEDVSTSVTFYLEDILTKYLYKTSTVYKSDINGFGKYAASLFLTLPEFNAYDWQTSYANSTFKVSIDSNIEMRCGYYKYLKYKKGGILFCFRSSTILFFLYSQAIFYYKVFPMHIMK